MTTSSTRIGRLALTLAALTLATAGGAAAQTTPKPNPTDQLARNYAHEDVTYRGERDFRILGPTAPVTTALRAPTDAIARHFDHEDAIYEKLNTASSLPAATIAAGNRFDWNDALVGAGATLGLLLLAAAALIMIHRGRSSGHAVES